MDMILRIQAFLPLVEEFDPYVSINASCTLLQTSVTVTYPDGFAWTHHWPAETPLVWVIRDTRFVCVDAMSKPEPWIDALQDKFHLCVFDDEDPNNVRCRTHDGSAQVRPTLCNVMYDRVEASRIAVGAERKARRYV
jgi:hypothetical protein